MISKFHQKYPKIEFIFFEGTYDEIIEWLETGVIDIGFVVHQHLDPKLHVVPLIRDPMVVAFPKGHRFEKLEAIDVQDLEHEPFIMPKGIYRAQVEDIFKQAKITPMIRFKVHDYNTVANMVQEELGITIGPELFLKNQQKIRVRPLKQMHWRCVALACPSIQCASPAVQAFLEVAQGAFEK
ncbi:hypothetical protein C4A75_13955 [Brevibacillus laterosporus]|uniref:LysR family transcriptional regulator substrate-binding protein n=1 Tax=Brevibacillus laterosporus TaxID=1465 RepID=UPI000CE57A6B|nr:LysR family transcriptional regulator substrate-binding protein [Brevibacillus laterosporus]PPA83821.1 hypothetical protein C4A75_13955 [Brevibacillus laterosporus]